jgi:hypothetical protein
VENYDRSIHTTDDNILQHMCFACWITKATDTNSEYVIVRAFSWQQLLHEHASLLTLPVLWIVKVDLTCSDSCALKG